ncbi:MMPL family transporter [Brevibacterium sp. BRM-1]|uniref:MMPL family transporter n=1 Tax=Brevibacterium sp. BRM-1 TaxID=2999062 RepID=UPI00227DE290|nr:MMPL family transporter [Brevibacterium sp. BRM-1]WAL39250.1 MMPL family transporter [Brevibacterium sp. BRM-1]
MSSFLYELGRTAFRRRKTFAAAWLVILVLLGGFVAAFKNDFSDSFTLPGSESQEAQDSLKLTFPQASGAAGSIIVVAPEGQKVTDKDFRSAIGDAVDRVDDFDHVESATSPFSKRVKGGVSEGDRAAIINISYDDDYQALPETVKSDLLTEVDHMKQELPNGTQVAPGGDIFKVTGMHVSWVEGLGVAIAFVVLLFTFGSALAAGIPLVTAILGVMLGLMLIVASTAFADVSSTAPMLALMLGLAVGIDYALFIISRARSLLRDGLEPEEAVARALATAGSAVVFAGMTVIIALVGLMVCRMPFLTVMGFGAAGTVAVAVLVALTLVPALMGMLGKRLIPRSVRRARARAEARGEAEPARASGAEPVAGPGAPPVTGGAHAMAGAEAGAQAPADTQPLPAARGARPHAPAVTAPPATSPHGGPERKRSLPQRFYHAWVSAATKIPILTVLIIVVGLGLFAIPASKLQLALPNNGGEEAGSPARVTYDLTEEYFGPGYNGPLVMTAGIIGSDDPLGDVDDMKKEIEKVAGVERVVLATPNENADTALFQIVPTTGPSDPQTEDVVNRLRDLEPHFQDAYGFNTAVTGSTAVGIDVSSQLAKSLLPFGIFVVGLSLILLTMVFRSIAVPIKATVGFLLSVVAAMGVVSLVFVEGHGASLFNLEQVGPIISFLPIMLMGILFGLAMDYEVFLVSGMREAYVHGASAKEAIVKGFMSSASVVVAAAIIMFSVFFAFVPTGEPIIKSIALGLAVGIFVDAFIVRMTLVPAVMALLGNAAWWLPKWLDRLLPHFDVEGEGLYHQVALRDWPEPDSPYRVYGKAMSLGTRGHRVFEDVDIALLPGELLALTGPGAEALLFAISGRANLDSGDLKVGSFVLPEQANKVRKRTPYLMLNPADPDMRPRADHLRDLAAAPPELLVVDAADQPHDQETAELVSRLIAAALQAGSAVVLTLGNPEADWMIPARTDYTLLDLAAHRRGAEPTLAPMGGHR